MVYGIKVRNGRDFNKVGKIVYEKGKVKLDIQDPYWEDFFKEIGMGEKGYTPRDGALYMRALRQTLFHSSMVVLTDESKQ
jgi:hypothetical protein